MLDYVSLEHSLSAWAATQPAISALVVVGSRARADHPADAWSDLDLILFTTAPEVYAADAGWLTAHGDVWLLTHGHTGHGDVEWLVLFAGGRKVDCVIAPVAQAETTVQAVLAASPYQFVYERGMRVLYARGESSNNIPTHVAPRSRAANPSAAEFFALVDSALLAAVRAVKFLGRGDLWRAKRLCDGELHQRLLNLLEWHAHALHGLDRDTWHDGRYLEEWADPRAVAALPQTFSAYDRADQRRALAATLDLLHTLAQEIAGALGFAYPGKARAQAIQWIRAEALAGAQVQ